MNNIGNYLVEELIKEIENITDYVVVYSGRFQPFHKGHFATYQHLVKKFGKDNVYIGTSDKTDKLKSPFNFKEKQTIMTKMFGIPSNKIVQIKNPYAPVEILKKFDENTTAFITVVGEKDEQRLGGKYFTPYKGELEAGYAEKGHVYISPAQPNAISGTDVRNWLGSGEIEDRKKLFSKAYPKFDEKIFQLITSKLSSLNESGSIDAGEPDVGYYVDGARRIINGAKPENWFTQGGYKQLDKPKSDNMRGKGKTKDKESQFRKVTFQLKGVTQPDEKNKRVPYQVDKWKKVPARSLKKAQPRYYDLDKIKEQIFIPKEFIEEWINLNLNHILSEISTSTAGPATNAGKIVDDGPNGMFPNYDTFDLISKERAEQIGYTVFKQIMSGELEDYYEHPIYPNGPVKTVSTFPAGIITKTTDANQADMDGDIAYEKWYNHVTRSMALVGYQLVKDFDKLAKDMAIKSADNLKLVADAEKLSESGMGLAMGYPSKEQLAQMQKEREKLRAQMDRESEYYEPIEEDITIPINIGDTVLGGKFKNKRIVVKDIGKNEKGDITINNKPLLKFRLIDDAVKETINEGIVNELFLGLLAIIGTAAATGLATGLASILRVINSRVVDFLLNGVVVYGKNVKNLIKPDQFTKFTTELSRNAEFNKKFIDTLVKHGGIKNTNIDNFLKDITRTKEFNDILDKHYPKNPNVVVRDGVVDALLNFELGIKNTLKSKGGSLISTIKNKFPELKDINTESILFEIPMDDLQQLDKFADKQMSPIDVVLTGRHFLDRLVDKRNQKPISAAELTGFFKRLSRKKTEFVEFLKKYGEIVAKDNRTKINIPFMQQANKAIAKTIMRKDDFKSPDPELKFEMISEDTIKHISKSLGVSRDKMPQINSKDVSEFVKYLKDKGIEASSSLIDVSKIGMTQKDINVDKVRDLLGVEKSNLAKPVIISKDNYILDGHHRVVALYNVDKNFKLKTIKIDLGIKDLLNVAREFPKASFKSITEFYGNYDTRHIRPAAPIKGLDEPDENHKDVE